MQRVVNHWGLHTSDTGVMYLHQETPTNKPIEMSDNALGLSLPSPFTVACKYRCNHLIPLDAPKVRPEQWDEFMKLYNTDPLVRLMSPIPTEHKAWYLHTFPDQLLYLTMLSQMTSALRSVVLPVWRVTNLAHQRDFTPTNIQSIVYTSVEPSHTDRMYKWGDVMQHMPRTLVAIGSEDVVLTKDWIRTYTNIYKQDLDQLMLWPWANLGAQLLRKYMRNEM